MVDEANGEREIALNPYTPPMTSSSAECQRLLNPARTLLFVIGAVCVIQGVLAIPTGLFVGFHILAVAIGMLAFGMSAIWLGRRHFDAFGRYATIVWGALAISVIVFGIVNDPPSSRNFLAIVLLGIIIATIASVPLMALIKRPINFPP